MVSKPGQLSTAFADSAEPIGVGYYHGIKFKHTQKTAPNAIQESQINTAVCASESIATFTFSFASLDFARHDALNCC